MAAVAKGRLPGSERGDWLRRLAHAILQGRCALLDHACGSLCHLRMANSHTMAGWLEQQGHGKLHAVLSMAPTPCSLSP